VVMPKDVLAKATCADLEALVNQVAANREITEVEQHAIKRQKRMIKNRDYSLTHRKKTKFEIGELQTENQKLKQEKEILTKNVSILQQENCRLTFENSQYRATLNGLGLQSSTPHLLVSPNSLYNTPQNITYPMNNTNLMSTCTNVSHLNTPFTAINLNSQNNDNSAYHSYVPQNPLKSNAAVATFTIFIILFSFGIFFGPNIFASGNFDQSAMKGSSRALFGSNPIGFRFTNIVSNNVKQTTLRQQQGHMSFANLWGLGLGLPYTVNNSVVEDDQLSQPEKVS